MRQWSSFIADAKVFMKANYPSPDDEPPKPKTNPWRKHLEEKRFLQATCDRLRAAIGTLKLKVSNLEADDAATLVLYEEKKDLRERVEELEDLLSDEQGFKDLAYRNVEELKQKNYGLQADYETTLREVAECGRAAKRNREEFEREMAHCKQEAELRVQSARMEGKLELLQRRTSASASPSQPSCAPLVN